MTVEEDVRAFNDAFERALAEADAEAAAAMYTEDARLLLTGQPMIRGRSAIGAIMRAWVDDGPVSIRFETEEVIAGGDLVIDIGHSIAAGRRSKYVVVLRRQPDGSLKLAIDAPSSEQAATVPAATE